jgi:hypothetical protein
MLLGSPLLRFILLRGIHCEWGRELEGASTHHIIIDDLAPNIES